MTKDELPERLEAGEASTTVPNILVDPALLKEAAAQIRDYEEALQWYADHMGHLNRADAVLHKYGRRKGRSKNPKGRVIPCAECETPHQCRDVRDTCGKFGEEHIYREAKP